VTTGFDLLMFLRYQHQIVIKKAHTLSKNTALVRCCLPKLHTGAMKYPSRPSLLYHDSAE
jgi:hypothetical protein